MSFSSFVVLREQNIITLYLTTLAYPPKELPTWATTTSHLTSTDADYCILMFEHHHTWSFNIDFKLYYSQTIIKDVASPHSTTGPREREVWDAIEVIKKAMNE
jgi:hypothetical protein